MQNNPVLKTEKTLWVLLLLSSIGVACYALFAYGVLPLGNLVHPAMKATYNAHATAIYTHIFASALALALGPLQFSQRLRQNRTSLHRLCGKLYLFAGVLPGGLAGLYMAPLAFGGIVSTTGFATLSVIWLFTAAMAFNRIRKRDILSHRRWMICNFALTFAAVTLRLYLGIFSAAGFEFANFYPLLAWLCWVPNIVFALLWISVKK